MQPTSVRSSRPFVALMLILGVIFIGRLFYVQVIQHGYYEAEAIKEHTSKFVIPAKRGEIYALDGADKTAPLVLNEPAYTVYADPRYVKDEQKTADVLRRIAGGNTLDKFEDSLKNKDRQYVVLARQINKQQADLLKKENLPGVGMQAQEKRVYPEGALAAQVLGFVNGEGKGQYGLEQGYNDELAGKPGLLKAITDVNGIPISVGGENIQTPAQDGKDVVLSIDRNIQAYTEQALKAGLDRVRATRGSVVVINPNDGQIMAMANLPTFDPRDYSKVQDYRAFQNAIISDPYEAGSVTKTLTMGVGLNEGVIQPDTTYYNRGYVKVADATIKNAGHELENQSLTMTQVLQFSYNTGAVEVLKRLGGSDDVNNKAKQKLYQYFTDHYFFGKPTGITLAGEASGEVISPDNEQGGPVRYANMTFGQGLTVTMLQEAAAFAAAVNGGTYYMPKVIAGYLNDDGKLVAEAPAIRKPDTLSVGASEKLRLMAHEARSRSPLGRSDKPGYTIGGKTGTAQVYDPKTGRYSETDTIGSYVGFGGQTKPEYVIMVRVDDAHIGDFAGSAAAAPIFGDISNWLIDYLKIQPKG